MTFLEAKNWLKTIQEILHKNGGKADDKGVELLGVRKQQKERKGKEILKSYQCNLYLHIEDILLWDG